MKRTQFTFYESFFEALEQIPKKADQAEAYRAICRYALYGEEPCMESLPPATRIAFHLIRPVLDASRRKAESGSLGGQRKKSRPEATVKQTASKGEKEKENENENENESETEIEIEGEHECDPPAPLREPRKPSPPPTYEMVWQEAALRGRAELAKGFYDYYASGDWRDARGRPVRAWRQKLAAWIIREGPPQDKRLPPSTVSWSELAAEMDREEAGL